MKLRNIRVKDYEWTADVYSDELSSVQQMKLFCAGHAYEELTVHGEFYVLGGSTPNPAIKVNGSVTLARGKYFCDTTLSLENYKAVTNFIEKYCDKLVWAEDAKLAKGDKQNEF